MSEREQGLQPVPSLDSRGFEDEVARAADTQAAAPPETPPRQRLDWGGELRRNFNSIFGHGIGKAALMVAVLFIVVAGALALRGFTRSGRQHDAAAARVDVPSAPAPRVSVDPIDEKEAARRAQRATMEAEAAQRQGRTYQADFTPAVLRDHSAANASANAQPPIPLADGGTAPGGRTKPPLPADTRASQQPVNITVPAGISSANGGGGPYARQAAQEEQRRQTDLDRQRVARDKYVEELRNGVKAQVEDLIGDRSGLRAGGVYSVVRYLPVEKPGAGDAAVRPESAAPTQTRGAGTKKILFKAGKVIFATLDAEVNTDDGGDVFATVQGGPFGGSKLIGKIEQAPRNIRVRFSTLAPPDDRPTLSVDAIGIREQDAKEGIAESVNHHTLERYSALLAGSMLQGLGQAAAQPQGTAIVLPNGQTVVQQQEVTNKRILLYALGDVGTNAGAEVRKTFSEAPTYKTPAEKGIGVVFLTDVTEK